MRALGYVLSVIASILFAGPGVSQTAAFVGANSPYNLQVNNGEPDGVTIPSPPSFCDATGKTYVPLPLTGTKALLVVVGQSVFENAATGTYTTVNATALNFSICDRGIYKCSGLVVGTPWVPGLSPSGNSPNCQIADGLITAGTYQNVIMATAAIGGSMCSDWNTGGALKQRISALYNGLASRGLTTASGFVGDVYILWHDGETDNQNSTPRATLATCLRSVAGLFASAGFGTTRFIIATESLLSGVASSVITGAQADAVASGCSTCRAGANIDAFTGTNRQDGTHPTAAGASNMAAADVTIITNCHNLGASC